MERLSPEGTDPRDNAVFIDDDGTEYHGQEAIARMYRHGVEQQEKRERTLARMTPRDRRLLELRYATNTAHVSTSHRCLAPPATGARRTAGPGGRPRAQAARSSAGSGDSGDDGPGEPAQLTLGLEPDRPRTTTEAKALAWERLEHLRALQEAGRL